MESKAEAGDKVKIKAHQRRQQQSQQQKTQYEKKRKEQILKGKMQGAILSSSQFLFSQCLSICGIVVSVTSADRVFGCKL